jgi:hypothetical protein
MEQHPNDLTTDAEIDAALERAKAFDSYPRIVEAVYRPEAGWECLMIRLDNGRRLLIPREQLDELKDATPEQASEITLSPQRRGIWWPQLDEGLYLPDFLEYRWGKEIQKVAA